MEVISARQLKTDFSLKAIIGKKVICENGEIIGRVKDIAFDANNIMGIYVWGIFKTKKMLIDRSYIDEFNSDSIILKINPITTLLRRDVFDKDGKKLGKVKRITRNTHLNDFESLLVKKNLFTPSRTIPKSDIGIIGKNIILNKVIQK